MTFHSFQHDQFIKFISIASETITDCLIGKDSHLLLVHLLTSVMILSMFLMLAIMQTVPSVQKVCRQTMIVACTMITLCTKINVHCIVLFSVLLYIIITYIPLKIFILWASKGWPVISLDETK